jgi:replicative DNA helicase
MAEFDPLDVVYSPQQVFDIGTRYLEYRRTHKDAGIPIGLNSLDVPDTKNQAFLPALPGELITIIGRPGNGKTGFMMRWARYRAKWLKDNGYDDRVVVYATYEQSIEELHAFHVAAEAREAGSSVDVTKMARGEISDQEWDAIMRAGAKRVELPLWFIGHSLARRKKRPNLTTSALMAGLDGIERWYDKDRKELQIDMVFVDYLQRIKSEGRTESKTIAVSDNLDRCKDGALTYGCPWIVGVQASRDVDSRTPLPIPQMDDGQWTSNIEQASDGIISVVRPRKYKKDGDMFGSVIVEGHCQMLVSVLKRKLGPDNFAKWVYFSPEYNKLDELEVKHYELNEDGR